MTIRKDLLRMVLRDTLQRSGIPQSWVGAELLTAVAQDGGRGGLHIRLLVRHWDPRLLTHGFALQQRFRKDVLALDGKADEWFLGASWQFDLPDGSVCPPMPSPSTWGKAPDFADSFAAEADTASSFGAMFGHTTPSFRQTMPAGL